MNGTDVQSTLLAQHHQRLVGEPPSDAELGLAHLVGGGGDVAQRERVQVFERVDALSDDADDNSKFGDVHGGRDDGDGDGHDG